MSIFVWLVIFVILLAVSNYYSSKNNSGEKIATSYHYKKKQRIMTDHEFAFYTILNDAVGGDYYILTQAHLSSFIDHKVPKQNWKAAFRHINSKSVDYLLCNNQTLEPVLAIELDDRTHELEDRILRDKEIERIFTESSLPLLRMPSHGSLTNLELKQIVNERIDRVTP